MSSAPIQPFDTPIMAGVSIPGSKSYTLRALVLAALTCLNGQPVRLRNPLDSEDPVAMIACLKKLGVRIEEENQDLLVKHWRLPDVDTPTTLDCDMSGASIRFLLALCCVIPGVQVLQGKARLNERPIGDLVEALKSLGADITYLGKLGYPTVCVNSTNLTENEVEISGKTSSQFLSALLMIGPMIEGGLTVSISDGLISLPYVEMTLDIMAAFGVKSIHVPQVDVPSSGLRPPSPREGEGADPLTFEFTIPAAQTYKAAEYSIEPDVSSACYFGAIAALTGSTINLHGMNPASKQGDMEFFEILAQMGNVISWENQTLIVQGHGVHPVTVDMSGCPDQAQTLAVLAAFAEGTTVMTGVKSLRVKETERVIAVQNELEKMGIRTEATEDSLTIYGGNPQPATIKTYGDHRMAMAFAVAGTKLPGMKIEDPGVVAKTFPTFWETLAKLQPLQEVPA